MVSVAVHGELDLAHASELKHVLDLQLHSGTTLLLDLSDVEFIDSTGLAAIVAALNRARDGGGKVVLTGGLQPQARRLMELTGVLAQVEAGMRNGSG
jgi:anti-sigma B factor antagonist